MRPARLVATWILGLAAVTAAGCNDFHYYDITVTFNTDPATSGFGPNEPASIQMCVFSVSGADSISKPIGPHTQGLPLPPGGTTLGIIEFSTFADSGTLNFKIEAYDASSTASSACKVGEGTKSVMASSASTVMDNLVVNKTGTFDPNCQ